MLGVLTLALAVSLAAPETSAEAADTSNAVEDTRPWVKQRNGRGLAIAAVGTGVVALGAAGGIVSASRADCGFEGCVYQFVGLEVVRGLANATSLGLAIPAGVRAGRSDAQWAAKDEDLSRRSRVFVGVGAAALGVGAAGWIASWTLRFRLGCERQACFIGNGLGIMSGFSVAAAGSGLLSYGLALRGASRREESGTTVHVAPALGVGHTGLTLAGRF